MSCIFPGDPRRQRDPAPPLRMGPQRCLSSRETIERLVLALRPVPELEVSEDSPAHWRDIFERDFPEAVYLTHTRDRGSHG